MVRYPMATSVSKQKQYTVNFGGLNMTENCREGEFRETFNLSGENFPIINQRATRTPCHTVIGLGEPLIPTYAGAQTINICARNGLINTIYFPNEIEDSRYMTIWEYIEDGQIKGGGLCFSPQKPKAVVAITDSVIVFPLGQMLSVGEEGTVSKNLKETFSATSVGGTWVFGEFTKEQNGTEKIYGIGAQKYFSSDFPFSQGDTVKIEGCSETVNNKYATIRGEITTGWTENVEFHVIPFDYNIFEHAYETSFTLSKTIPDFDFAVEWNNRIWGLAGDTIYASALGDPSNYFRYDGTATDSWAVAIGSAGDFTGMAAFGDQLLLFKENCIHRIYGSTPSSFSLTTITAPGVQLGSEKSICNVRSVLYYKAPDGVYAYDGSFPIKVSDNLTGLYSEAVAGSDGERYYISMKDSSDKWGLYVYNTLYGTWLKEDNTKALAFAYYDNTLFYVDAADNTISIPEGDTNYRFRLSAIYRGYKSVYLPSSISDQPFEWSAELCPITETTKDKKSYSRLWLRAELTERSWIKTEYSCDGGPWIVAATEKYSDRSPVADIPIRPDRCDSFRIRISGYGRVNLRAIVREVGI